jgi:hypothetical protein
LHSFLLFPIPFSFLLCWRPSNALSVCHCASPSIPVIPSFVTLSSLILVLLHLHSVSSLLEASAQAFLILSLLSSSTNLNLWVEGNTQLHGAGNTSNRQEDVLLTLSFAPMVRLVKT